MPQEDEDSRTVPQSARRRFPLFARVMAVVLIVCGSLGLGTHLWVAYDHELYHARLLASSMTEAVALQVDGSFRGIEGLLEDVASAVKAGQWSNPAVRQRISGRMMSFPELRWVGFVTADGMLTPDTEPPINVPRDGLNVADRDYVRHAQCGPRPKMRVGQPVLGRATGERSVHLALPIATANQSDCKGLVVAAVNPDHFAEILETVLLDPAGGSAVINLDGFVVARAPEHAAKFGMDLSRSPLFTEFLPQAANGVARLISRADSNEKFLGYKTLGEYGLVVTSGISMSRAMSNWYGLATVEIPIFLLFSVGIYLWAQAADRRRETMLRHQAGLEAAVAERTAMLAASKSLAEERAERLARVNAKLAHLARITAHHLQEPVRPIVSFSQLARREMSKQAEQSSELDGHLRFVEDAGRQLKAILKEFHRYTALLVKEPKIAPCNLSQVVERCLSKLSPVIAAASARIDVGDLPMVQADPALIEQALVELISNGIKYRHPDRFPEVAVRGGLDGGEAGNGGWWLSVSDNGRGLPEVGRQHLFEAFSRLNPDEPAAIGLGLAVCREVAEMHGGAIWADSLESGSVFMIRVPGANRAGLAA
ncbi:MAG TPA: ATP-binding protein [Candidatus Sulfotelmatobacter sp.]|nr:ATP-binding protein [Candidatus Sulfotelmatobacter sp.]